MSKDSIRGRFAWYDLFTPDVDAGLAFYQKVVGWGTEPFGDGSMPYTMLVGPHGALGGIMHLNADMKAMGAPPHWMAYATVDDCAKSAKLVEKLGGKILMPPTDIPTVGTFFTFADPQGAVISGFTPLGEFDLGPKKDAPRTFGWSELATTDSKAAFDFYHQVFGWVESSSMEIHGGDVYRMYKTPAMTEGSLGGMFTRPKEMPVSAWLHYITVGDLDEALGVVKAEGGKVLNGPMQVPGGDRVAQCMDPQGGMFALHWSKPAN